MRLLNELELELVAGGNSSDPGNRGEGGDDIMGDAFSSVNGPSVSSTPPEYTIATLPDGSSWYLTAIEADGTTDWARIDMSDNSYVDPVSGITNVVVVADAPQLIDISSAAELLSDGNLVQTGYNPSGNAHIVSDQTHGNHTVSDKEAAADAKAVAAASLWATMNSDPENPFAADTTPVEKAAFWMTSHPGWMNQDQEYWPTLSDFSIGGVMADNYGYGSPYSVDHPAQ